MNEKKWIVYLHYNKINKKKYFGITKQLLSRRFRKNGEGYKHSPIFYNAIQKYGWDSFNHIIIKDNLTQQQALGWEKWLIQQYHTTNINFGYNITEGGDITNNSNLISEKNKQRWQNGIYNNIKKSVYCIELDQYFNSAMEAEKVLSLDNSTIQKACKGLIKYCGIKNGQALHWLYTKDITKEKIELLKNKQEILKGVSIPVYCVELNKLFQSSAQAGQLLNIDPSSIRKAIKNQLKTAGKMHWIEKKELLNIGIFN